ncbi:TolB family protein [Streptomyces mirabilis]|uniref:TolB family protein n=1 Tax=Streptomyces mirabilis TaxID=68239 RepID=UPI0033253A4A
MHVARRTTLRAAVVAALAGTAIPAAAQRSSPGPARASVATDGRQADGASAEPALSANGRYIAFVSAAANLVRGDTNGVADVFVHDLRTGRTQRIAQGPATGVALSGDGRNVVFATTAVLTEDDDNSLDDIYLYDRRTHRTERISHADAPPRSRLNYSPVISANGRIVAYTTATPDAAPGDTNGRDDVIVHDRRTGKNELVQYRTDGTLDVFVKDLRTGAVERVSVAADGTEADRPAVGSTSLSDHRIAFSSAATNLVRGDTNDTVDVFVMRHIAGSAPGATTTTP